LQSAAQVQIISEEHFDERTGTRRMSQRETRITDGLDAARTGSLDALGQVLEACHGFLLLIAREELDADLRAKGGASDLVQETFVEAQRDFARFHGQSEAELLAWLRQLLLNNVRDFTRRFQRGGMRGIDREVSIDAVDATGGLGLFCISDSASPSEKVIRREKATIVRAAIERLPVDYQRVLLLRYEEARSFEEIGTVMQRSANAARKLWLRALERIEQELERSP
jgi:RNA polymerase sigma-70 factor, ECF subfamily